MAFGSSASLVQIARASIRAPQRSFAHQSRPEGNLASKPVSPHIGFYKSFGRPVAKVFLGAIFTYQAAYWLWVKLENDEIKREKTGEIAALEKQLQNLQNPNAR